MALLHTPTPSLGLKAPDFALPGTDGKVHRMSDARGALGLLVMFLCNHCPYVKAIRERLVTDVLEIQRAGVGVVAISANDPADYPEDGFDSMVKIAKQYHFPFPYLYDESQAVAKAYGAVCTPDFFGFNANLELQFRGRLDSAHTGPRLPDMKRELVDAMLKIAKSGKGPTRQWPSMGCSIKWKQA